MSSTFELRFPSLADLYDRVDHHQADAQTALEKVAEQARELQKSLDKLAQQPQRQQRDPADPHRLPFHPITQDDDLPRVHHRMTQGTRLPVAGLRLADGAKRERAKCRHSAGQQSGTAQKCTAVEAARSVLERSCQTASAHSDVVPGDTVAPLCIGDRFVA